MVADKVISTLSGGMCPDDDDMTMIEAPCVKPTDNFDGAKIQDVDTNTKELEGMESSLDNFCEVVVSYRCKFCPFVATDRLEVKRHVSSSHAAGNAIEKNDSNNGNNNVANNNSSEPDLKTNLPQDQVEARNHVTGKDESDKDEVFYCSECSVIFSSADLCYNHMVQVHNLQAFSTDLIRENPLTSHQQQAPTESKRKRIRCSKPSIESANGKRAKSSSDGDHMCQLCKTKFSSPNAVQIHERCHIAVIETSQVGSNVSKKPKTAKNYVKGYTCCYCVPEKTGKFLTWGKCAFHLWKDHEIDCDLYTCSVCKYKTPTLAKLKDHELLHSSEAKFTCSTCRKSFKQFKQLKTHEKYHKTNNTKLPPPNEARWYTPKECPVCGRILSDSKCLKKHISAVHNKMKPYVCNICGHTSARKAELKLHVRQHTGEKPYKCPACPFSTGDHNSLRKHKRRHADSRPYECPHCDYSAIQSHAFKKHVLAVHAGQDVVFVCPSCPLVTVNEKIFEAHRKDHEDGRIPSGLRNDSAESPKSNQPHTPPADDSSHHSSSSESSEDKTSKFWLRDEDSIEVVDTGGITIPAPEADSRNDVSHAATVSLSKVPEETRPSSFLQNGSSFGGNSQSEDAPKATTVMNNGRHDSECSKNNSFAQDDSPAPGNVEKEANQAQDLRQQYPDTVAIASFGSIDESRAVSIVAELLAEGDSNALNQFFMDPLLNDSIDLPDILCNDHSNDGTLEKLLNMNVTGFS